MPYVTPAQMVSIRGLAAVKGLTYNEAILEYGINAGSGELTAYDATGIIEWLSKPEAKPAALTVEFQAAMDTIAANRAENEKLDAILEARRADYDCFGHSEKREARDALRRELEA